ncbi:uncharacterized protein LOC142241696 [Haematobia irritans]|uniref:uncharacterized protein LOC142241696 n=1 Tax=Haematobia irritans TaxID=7368 RepID=UPI003F50952B
MITQHIPAMLFSSIAIFLLLHGMVAGTNIDLLTSCSLAKSTCLLSNVTDTYEDPLRVSSSPPLGDLEELVIRSSALRRIPKAILELAPNLKKLVMHDCGLHSLNSKDFLRNGQLKILAIQENSIFTITENIFQILAESLEELYLRNNVIRILNRRAFEGLKNLKYLDAPHNGISALQVGIFDDLVNLEHLDMSYNNIEMIGSQTFAKNLKLSSINLSDNKFSVFEPNSLRHLAHLKFLDLSHSQLEDLHLQSVDYLQVSATGLRNLHIEGPINRLFAANNSLCNLNITSKTSLEEIQMQGNLLESLDDFKGMLNLQRLDVSQNLLIRLTTSREKLTYMELPNLKYLNMAANHLRNLSQEDFLLMTKLVSLDLGKNHLFELSPNILEPLKNLQYLYLDNNHLMELDITQMKKFNPQLKEIALENNDWNDSYQKFITNKLQQQDIYVLKDRELRDLPASVASRDVDFETLKSPQDQLQMHSLVGVSGIHPYWTLRDILAFITLLLVLLILLLQFWRILQEEQCCRPRANRDTADAEPLVHNDSLF